MQPANIESTQPGERTTTVCYGNGNTPLGGATEDKQCECAVKLKVKVGFFYSATYSGNAATSRAVQS